MTVSRDVPLSDKTIRKNKKVTVIKVRVVVSLGGRRLGLG